jgi:hypothetical protein
MPRLAPVIKIVLFSIFITFSFCRVWSFIPLSMAGSFLSMRYI